MPHQHCPFRQGPSPEHTAPPLLIGHAVEHNVLSLYRVVQVLQMSAQKPVA